MVALKTFTAVDLISYSYILANVADEYGGARTAFYYDLLLRTEMAKSLERGVTDLAPFLSILNVRLLDLARTTVDVRMKIMGQDAAGGKADKVTGKKFEGKCNFCGKQGHMEKDAG